MLGHISFISYSAAAAAFIFASVLLITSRAQHRYKVLLIGACGATALWAATIAAVSLMTSPPPALIPVAVGLELVRSIAWMIVVGYVLFFAYAKRIERTLAIGALVGTTVAVVYVLAIATAIAFGNVIDSGLIRLAFIARVLIAILGLLMAENLFRNSGREARWAVKYLCFGLGIIFAYDFLIYAGAALVDRVDIQFQVARGFIDTMAVPMIIIAAARSKKWPIDLHVSRQFVLHSATLLAAGLYLVMMAMVAYSLRLFAGPWGGVAQAAFLSAALVLLAVVLSSGKMQAVLRDFIAKNFFSYKYDYRHEWLRFIAAISGDLTQVSVPERVVRAMADLVESTSGAIWLHRPEDHVFQVCATWNMDDGLRAIDDDSAFIAALASRPGIVHVARSECDGKTRPDLAIPAWLSESRAWLVIPLLYSGKLLGLAVLGQPRAPRHLGWEDFELLATAGCQAASYLAEADTARSLAEARRFEEFNRHFAFVIHDVKNLAGQMTLILKNAERHGDNPEFQKDMLHTISQSVVRVRGMLERLDAGKKAQPKLAPIDLSALLARHAANWKLQIPVLDVDIPEESVTVVGDAERLDAVLSHLVQNAFDAAGEQGRVAIALHIEGVARANAKANGALTAASAKSWGVIIISDNGPGMDPAFVDQKLFQPLTSAKPSGFGIGAFQARQLIREMGGRLEVDTCVAKGTRMIVRLPLARALATIRGGGVEIFPGRERQVNYG